MKAIVIADEKWGVSNKGKSLIQIPAERKSMMDSISGHVAVYDYKYVDELPGQQAIPECKNIVFTDGADVTVKNATMCRTLEQVKEALDKLSSDEVYIIHGAKLYNFFEAEITTYHVTHVEYTYQADEFIKDISRDPHFKLTHDSDELYLHDMVYEFWQYDRI